jgi:hypothetical protein
MSSSDREYLAEQLAGLVELSENLDEDLVVLLRFVFLVGSLS